MEITLYMKRDELHNKFIETIKFVRYLTGWGLKESKDFTEELRDKNPNNKEEFYQFTIPTNHTNEEILDFAMNHAVIFAEILNPAKNCPNLKGCFNMISPAIIHLYLEAGENNKLSMNVPYSKMQDIIKVFTDSIIKEE